MLLVTLIWDYCKRNQYLTDLLKLKFIQNPHLSTASPIILSINKDNYYIKTVYFVTFKN